MKKRLGLIVSILIIAMLAFAGCAKEESKTTAKNNESITVNIKHELGEATVKKNPKNVVVFDYGVLDSLDKMGIEVAALPKSNIPAYLEKFKDDKYKDAGTLQEPNFEKISELKPELIIISARQAKLYEEFKKIAPTVYLAIADKDYMGSFKGNMNILGEIFDKKEFVEKELKNIENSIKDLNTKAAVNGKKALIVMVSEGSISAYGEGSRFGVMHKEFGVTPVDKSLQNATHGQNISFEYIAEKNPDYLFVIDRGAIVKGGKTSAKQTLDNALIKTTSAHKNNKIVYLDSQIWYVSIGGFTGTNTMINEVQEALK
ncbi:siderophore ABC transporter substrate-binding protein [Desnuesiella massiliensis]|uniref:siderophore ABC transporter substrate-binding protein n=1 Tax=Desnuesiella massiliensis TaxID=1650662 RepID=UPI0006E1C80F|nr:siderophore ABC transporter substrate-binding protein [Desnuesiella massiliensis]